MQQQYTNSPNQKCRTQPIGDRYCLKALYTIDFPSALTVYPSYQHELKLILQTENTNHHMEYQVHGRHIP